MTAVHTRSTDSGHDVTDSATPRARRARRGAGRRLRRVPLHLVLVLLCGVWAVPVLALLISSLRTPYNISTSGWWHILGDGSAISVLNYRDVLTGNHLGTAFRNSLLIAVPAVAVLTCVGAVAAFALARMLFRGGGIIAGLLVALLVVPVQMTLVPILRLYGSFHLTGTFVGIWLVHIGFALPFAIYLMRNFFAAIPRDLFEAADLEGASMLAAFLRIALPLARPALASVAIFQFIWIWNDLLIALIFLGGDPSVAPLTVSIANLVSSTTGQGWQLLTAAAFIAMALPMLIFFALQKYFVRGLLAGAVK
jgi:alpha-glucoside transport system permease protein